MPSRRKTSTLTSLRRIFVTSVSAMVLAGALITPAAAGRWAQVREDGFARLATARELISSGKLADVVAAGAALAAVELPAGAPVGSPPSDVAGAVAYLSEVVSVAERMIAEATPTQVSPSLRRDVARAARAGREVDEDVFRAYGVDREGIGAAGLLVAAAVDEALPALQTAAGSSSAGLTVGCDQLEQGPVCVGGTGANLYESDYALLVDLGGDDVHANSAGGADGGNGLPVSVTIDMAGNDRYETALPTKSGSGVAQGSGALGVGVLLDVAGSDTYSVTSTNPASSLRGQGYAGIGVGILEDMGGNDSYSLDYQPTRNPAQRALGQGFGSFGLVGALLDTAGNDSYLAEATAPHFVDEEGRVSPGRPLVQAMGFGEAGGVGITADGGGADVMALRSESAVVSSEERREVLPAGGTAEGFGFATLGGAALAMSGEGNTTRTITTKAEAPAVLSTSAFGLGYASLGAFAALVDVGGNDSYVADTRAVTVRSHAAGDACTCQSAQASLEGGHAQVRAGGWGGAGVGIMQDLAGDDRYALSAVSDTRVLAHDEHTVPASPAAQAYAVGGAGSVHGLGYGSLGGAGFLDDRAGNDVYSAESVSVVRASATASAPSASTVAMVEGGDAWTWSQGLGSTGAYGELRDGAGSDVYRATADASAETDPSSDGSVATPPETRISVQGSVETEPLFGVSHPVGGFALLVDSDGGAADTFTASPSDPACTGTRGQGTWRDCGPTAGVGMTL